MYSKANGRNIFWGKTAVIVCHDVMFGPPHELRDYLLRHDIKSLIFIGHQNRSLPDNPVKSSYVEVYEDKVLVHKHSAPEIRLAEGIAYIRDFLLTWLWVIRYSRGTIQYFIGVGNLNALNGLLFCVFGKVKHSMYYVIDYIPERFDNPLMNFFYHRVDYTCARFCTRTWNYALGMVKARSQKWHRQFANQDIVPNGITMRKKLPGLDKKNFHGLVYLGSLVEQQGILFVIEAMRQLVQQIPTIKLKIIGMGPLEKTLKRRIHEYNLEKHIQMTGFIPDPYEVDKITSQASLGVAMYQPNAGFVAYTEPGKVKRYLACGVPVIMTDVSPLAHEIVKHTCGFCCAYDIDAFVKMVTSFFTHKDKIEQYRKNSLRYVRQFQWDIIFTRAFHFHGS